ncbi:AGAP005296-PA-like protein [Anopheles sinensis]|uniref:AGAP005296-PA-like protein n=1 Tax=Anopheles sinensis TaxID=74873 RepID=A0A084VXL9_ANOSI|nr:AGAP005296-PA-like protein [Anopheles sinensis]
MAVALRIFNFPPIFTNVDVREFLNLFGLQATGVFRRRTCHGAFVNVANEAEARLVISRLHQLLIKSHRIKVEYYERGKESNDEEKSAITDTQVAVKGRTFNEIQEGRPTINYEGFPPPYLLYRYPKHTPLILANICSELASNTPFYYQVLHLMNKMNLKAPFPRLDPDKEASTSGPVQPNANQATSEDESELESDDETNERKKVKLNHLKPTMKVLNYDKLQPKFQDVGKQPNKKPNIEIHISGESLTTTQSVCSAKSIATIAEEAKTTNESSPQQTNLISLDDILNNRIPEEQRNGLSVFQNYTPGEPTTKLYIKNLAKSVTEQDLQNVIRVFFEKDSPYEFNVKLMKTGRMKGQAFISFLPVGEVDSSSNDNLKQCVARVLSTINGYILKDKPMVVSYAKST